MRDRRCYAAKTPDFMPPARLTVARSVPATPRTGLTSTQILRKNHFFEERYPVSAGLLRILGLSATSTPEEVANVYRAYGVDFFGSMRIIDGNLEVTAYEPDHRLIAGINLLLENGFKITK